MMDVIASAGTHDRLDHPNTAADPVTRPLSAFSITIIGQKALTSEFTHPSINCFVA